MRSSGWSSDVCSSDLVREFSDADRRRALMDIKEALNRIVGQLDLTTEEMKAVMRQIMNGQCTDAQVGAFLRGLRMKSETIDEIVGAVRAEERRVGTEWVGACGSGGGPYDRQKK